ncbi:MAG: transposase, partial [Rhodospirillales bacterium]|nr:transposase [Rhodospirillales bacterium]
MADHAQGGTDGAAQCHRGRLSGAPVGSLPTGTRITILAERGFGDHKLFAFLTDLNFEDVIRFRGNVHVTAADGERRPAAEWVGAGGRARKLANATLTTALSPVPVVVCVHAKDMKEPWCLAASNAAATTPEIVNLYAKRWTIEPSFRDIKDLRFG